MAQSLQIFLNRHSPKPGHRSGNIYPHHAYYVAFVEKYERMIAGFGIVRVVLDVSFNFAAILEKHLAAYVMERAPFFLVSWPTKLMFEFDHAETSSLTMVDPAVQSNYRRVTII